jgi:threonine dehydrogenase-like Zn-dependent dehydrogenase
VLIVGHGFVGGLFAAVLAARGDEVFAVDADPARTRGVPHGSVDAVVLAAPGGVETALAALEPGGTLLVFADAGAIPAAPLYRRELTVVGSRSATPAHMREAVRLLPGLDVPAPTVLPLDRFAEGLELQRTRGAAKVVFVP